MIVIGGVFANELSGQFVLVRAGKQATLPDMFAEVDAVTKVSACAIVVSV